MITYEKTNWLSKQDDGNIAEGTPPINADNLNKIENGVGMCVDKINNHTEKISEILESLKRLEEPEEIWVNSYPNASFSPLIIDLDTSKYYKFSILIKAKNDIDVYCEHTVSCKNYKIFLNVGTVYSTDYDMGRCVTISDSGLSFGIGQKRTDGVGTYNNYAIPVQIIGYRC